MSENKCSKDIDDEILSAMRDDFLQEIKNIIDELNLNLITLEQYDPNDRIINNIFNMIHSLAGAASFTSQDKIEIIALQMENIFRKIQKEKLRISYPICEIMGEALKVLNILKEKIGINDSSEIDISGLIAKFARVLD